MFPPSCMATRQEWPNARMQRFSKPQGRNPLESQELTAPANDDWAEYWAFLQEREPELASVVRQWPLLSTDFQRAILAVVKSAARDPSLADAFVAPPR